MTQSYNLAWDRLSLVHLLFGVCLVISPTVFAQQEGLKDAKRSSLSVVQSKPVWEFGVGGGYFSGFDYPASKDQNRRFLALPFFIYRTPQIRFGDGGLRAVAIENPRVKLDVSLGGSLNANSEGNSAREGMPDLDFLFEFGPQLEVRLWDQALSSGGRLRVRFSSELRAVLVTDFSSVSSQGWVAESGIGINYRNAWNTGLDLFASFDATYANQRLQQYFYEVQPEFATPSRPVYQAKAGYLESKVFLGVGIRPRRNLRVFVGAFNGFYDGAANQSSPLYETTSSMGFAVGFAWTIKVSDKRVDIVDLGSNN